jgi:hypothetical protein
MAALTKDVPRRTKGMSKLQAYKVAANAVIFKGAIVCTNASGFLAPAADTANFNCVGIATEAADNTGGANGDLEILVYRGVAYVATTGGSAVTQAHVGLDAVVLDDNTVVLAAGATNDINAGEIMAVDSYGIAINFSGKR